MSSNLIASDEPHSDAILKRLLRLHPKVIDLSLDRMHEILAALGHPEQSLPPVIHVAGTNGKGSTIAFMRAILEAAGLRVHAYTSPHLVRFHERIRLGAVGGSHLITEKALSEALDHVEQVNGDTPITYFEITTAAAFHVFAETPADVLLLEVGLGGRLDATNVIDQPLVSVITPVDMDHMQFLGETLKEIAGEKAGIIKEGRPVVVAPQKHDGEDVIQAKADALRAPFVGYGRKWQVYTEHDRMVFQDDQGLLDLPMPALTGDHQVINAGTAIAALRVQETFKIETTAFEQGLITASWPARMQRLSSGRLFDLAQTQPEVWLDGGHNPAAASVLSHELERLNRRISKKTVLVCGMINTKDAQAFFEILAGCVDHVVAITIADEPNAILASDLVNMAKTAGLSAECAANIDDCFVALAQQDDPIRLVFAGSLYFAGAVLRANRNRL